MSLYETDEGQPVTTQSMIKTFRSCPREAYYKYALRLRPKRRSLPLTRGKWFHALLEAHYRGLSWREEHARWCSRFAKLFDEEKDRLGDLPRELERLLEGYLWHYREQDGTTTLRVHEVELKVEAELPNGHLFRGRLDGLVEDDYGLWVWDHKTHKRLPDWDYRMLDEQSPLYIWACHQMGIPVTGFTWNYVSTAGVDAPRVLVNGKRFYKRDGESDYPTYARAVKAAMAEHPDTFIKDPDDREAVRVELARLKAQRWEPGAMQTSPHFRRDTIEKDDAMVGRVLAAAVRTSDRMHAYDFSDPDKVERNVGTCAKGFLCSYQSLSLVDLVKGDSSLERSRDYDEDDPLAYYGEEERF